MFFPSQKYSHHDSCRMQNFCANAFGAVEGIAISSYGKQITNIPPSDYSLMGKAGCTNELLVSLQVDNST